MRPVLFALHPLGTGKVYRSLAVAEKLRALFPAIRPHFLAGPAAAALLRESTRLPVEEGLTPVVATAGAADGAAARRQSRRLMARHGQEVRAAARRLSCEMVVADGLLGAPAALRRTRQECVLLTDDLLDAGADARGLRRAWSAVLRRGMVMGSRLRFFVGQPAYLESPELRVWARRFFRFVGPVSGLARLKDGDAVGVRDDLGLGPDKVVFVAAGGTAWNGAFLRLAVQSLQRLEEETGPLQVLLVSGPELSVEDAPGHWRVHGLCQEAYRYAAAADLCLVPGGLSTLSECAGLGVPTLSLPLPGHPWQERHARFHQGRHGVRVLLGAEQQEERVVQELRTLLARSWKDAPRGTHRAPDARQQRTQVQWMADLIAEQLGRRRPGS